MTHRALGTGGGARLTDLLAAVLALVILLPLDGWSSVHPPASPGTAEGTLSFARSLLRGGDSFRAVTEYRRFLHHFPDHPGASAAREELGRAFATAGRFDEAVEVFRQVVRSAQPPPPSSEARRLLGSALYQAGRYQEASAVLLGDPDSPPDESAAVLGTLAHLRKDVAAPLPAGGRQDVADAYRELPRKSPGLAGTLSAVLPGAGHLYCDRPRDGLVSLVLNGAFIWGTYESARREQWALAGILGFFELGWYSGNIVSSMNAAHKWNRREQGRFLRGWEGSALPRWQLSRVPGGLGGSLTWRW